ncbi:MAG TPA: amidohydrolase family protein [Pyrinomonadaceae bacterium]|nr:amidohydrolase family protein [Pyrinomonadaceae bacterium]
MLKKLFVITLILNLLGLPVFAQSKQKVSLLLTNGKVFTADEKFTSAEAVAIDGEKIVAVGSTKDLREKYSAVKEIDLQGKLVTPGFNDAHVHFFRGALSLLTVNLFESKSADEAAARVAAKVKETKPNEWIIGRGWDHTLWGGKFPSREVLDKVAPNNPVFLVRVDGHIGWVNSAALKLAKIDKATKNPEGGEIERDANGEATGILKETSQDLVSALIPQPTAEQQNKGMELALKMAREYGITSVQDNSGYETTKLYRTFLKADKLTVRVAEWQDFEDSITELKRQRTEFASFKDNPSRLKLTALKGYVDGTLGSKTAAMLAPFSDDKGNSGIPRRPQEELTKMIVERDKEGFQIALHAIGDRANRMALDGYETAKKGRDEKSKAEFERNKDVLSRPTGGNLGQSYDGTTLRKGEFTFSEAYREFLNPLRHRIEHAQVVNPSDIKRFNELNIIASMQPTHAISDKRWADLRLGEYRVLGAYAWHFMKSYGVHVPFGTDFPVESINPYQTLYAAVSRQDADGEPFGGWQPQERLSMAEAIRCHTYESAYAEFAEKEKGEIKVGMFADLVVHSKDLLTIPHKEILTTEPIYTIFNGKIVYQK